MGGGFRGTVFFQNGGLNPRNVDRKVDAGAGTGLHAELVGADQAAGLSHRVVAGNGFDRAGKIVCLCCGDKLRRIAVDGAGVHAGFAFAAQTASQFGNQLGACQVQFFVSHFNLSEINCCL